MTHNAAQLAPPPEPPLPVRRWLTPAEAAAYLGVSINTLRALGVQPSKRLGARAVRYDRIKLDEAMEQHDD